MSVDVKGVWAGGMRNIPIDLEKSILSEETELDFSNPYEKRYNDYYKVDLRIGYKLNMKKISMEWALDISNVTNHKNRFFEMYNPDKKIVEQAGQMGIVPVMLYRLRF
ncbi:MAG: hypothetical protein HC906_07645 [Bacteroidales bacterium]|nr:hypothetical protein [Bacteroidales bacterium]